MITFRPSAAVGGEDSAAGSISSSSSSGGPATKSDFSNSLAKMVFRVPGDGGPAEKVDRLSLVVTSARAPFCLVTSVVIRGRCGSDSGEGEGDY